MARKSQPPSGYGALLTRVKQRVQTAQVKAALSANRELVLLYWDIGRAIVEAQKDKGYGKRVVEMLSADLRREFPAMSGLSALNLWRMRAFYLAYGASDQKLSRDVTESGSASQKLKQVVSESPAQRAIALQPAGQLHGEILSQPVTESAGAAFELLASLPWGHNIVLLQKLKELKTRLWYARAALEYGWSRSVLLIQIESRLHKRQGRAITNFTATLPAPQSDLAHQTLKDPYILISSRWTPTPVNAISNWACSITSKNSSSNSVLGSPSLGGNTDWKSPVKNSFLIFSFTICGCAASWSWTLRWKRSNRNSPAK